MKGADQSFNNNQETNSGAGGVLQPAFSLNFRSMLEAFFVSQCPTDPSDPKVVLPVNLKERRQK